MQTFGRIIESTEQFQDLGGKNNTNGLVYVYLEPHTTKRAELYKVSDHTQLPNPLTINDVGLVEDFEVDASYKYWILVTDMLNNEIFTRRELATKEVGGSKSNKYYGGSFVDITDNNVINVEPLKLLAVEAPLTLQEGEDEVIIGIDQEAVGANITIEGSNGINVTKSNNDYNVDGSSLQSAIASNSNRITSLEASVGDIENIQENITQLQADTAILNVAATDKWLHKDENGNLVWDENSSDDTLWKLWEGILTPKEYSNTIKGKVVKVQPNANDESGLEITESNITTPYNLTFTTGYGYVPFITNSFTAVGGKQYAMVYNGAQHQFTLQEVDIGELPTNYWQLSGTTISPVDNNSVAVYDLNVSNTASWTNASKNIGIDYDKVLLENGTNTLKLTADGIFYNNGSNIVTKINDVSKYNELFDSDNKDKYLHKNKETNAMEWVTLSSDPTITSLRSDVTANSTAIGTIQTNLTNVTSKANTNASNISALGTRVTTLESGVSTLNSSVSTLNTNVSSNTSRITTLEGLISGESSDLTELGKKVATNTANISTNTSNISKLTTRVSTAESGISTLNTTVGTLSTNVGTNTTDISTLKTSVAPLSTTTKDTYLHTNASTGKLEWVTVTKGNTYTAGTGISITNNVISNTEVKKSVGLIQGANIQLTKGTNGYTISATDTTYTAGDGISISNGVIANTAKGVTYTAGSGISIVNGTITNTAQGKTYSAGLGMTLSGTTFSVTNPLIAHSSQDSGKFLYVNTSGEIEWMNALRPYAVSRGGSAQLTSLIVNTSSAFKTWTLSNATSSYSTISVPEPTWEDYYGSVLTYDDEGVTWKTPKRYHSGKVVLSRNMVLNGSDKESINIDDKFTIDYYGDKDLDVAYHTSGYMVLRATPFNMYGKVTYRIDLDGSSEYTGSTRRAWNQDVFWRTSGDNIPNLVRFFNMDSTFNWSSEGDKNNVRPWTNQILFYHYDEACKDSPVHIEVTFEWCSEEMV